MIGNELPDFTLVINAMAATFRQEPTKAMLEGYWMGLEDLPIEAVKQAVVRAMRTKTFMPAVAELRGLAGELTVDQRAVKAWAAFEKAVVQHGGYTSVDFDDQTINATVRNLGGWERLCQLPPAEFDKWLRKDFERVYRGLANTNIGTEEGAALIGTHERGNQFNGYLDAVKPPLQITTGLPVRQDVPALPSQGRAPVELLEGIGQTDSDELAGPDRRLTTKARK